jgi:hypothetical protein
LLVQAKSKFNFPRLVQALKLENTRQDVLEMSMRKWCSLYEEEKVVELLKVTQQNAANEAPPSK